MSQLNVLHLTPVYDWIANSNVLIKKTMKKIKEIYKYLQKKNTKKDIFKIRKYLHVQIQPGINEKIGDGDSV